MGGQTPQSPGRRAWELARRQHGVVARAQLLELGLSRQAIEHRLARGRLHAVRRGVYVVGRLEPTRYGHWMAAILSCGPTALLSHSSAACLWGIGSERSRIEVSVPLRCDRRQPGITVHRRTALGDADRTRRHAIAVTTPIRTLIDIATQLSPSRLEAAINEADKLGLTDPEALRVALDASPTKPGAGALRRILDRRTFRLTASELERRLLAIVRKAGLPLPETGAIVNGFKVDFHWPDLGLVVETDGLRYHRTPTQQAKDRVRDQAHTAAGLTCLRFTHAQIRFEPDHVRATLTAVMRGRSPIAHATSPG